MPLRSTHSKSRGFHMQLAVKHGTKIADLPNDLIVVSALKKENLQIGEKFNLITYISVVFQ